MGRFDSVTSSNGRGLQNAMNVTEMCPKCIKSMACPNTISFSISIWGSLKNVEEPILYFFFLATMGHTSMPPLNLFLSLSPLSSAPSLLLSKGLPSPGLVSWESLDRSYEHPKLKIRGHRCTRVIFGLNENLGQLMK